MMKKDNASMMYISYMAYNYAIKNDIYYKIVEGEIDVSLTLEFFNVKECISPCEVVQKKYKELGISKNAGKKKKDFIHHFAIYYAFLDIYMGIIELANVRYTVDKRGAVVID